MRNYEFSNAQFSTININSLTLAPLEEKKRPWGKKMPPQSGGKYFLEKHEHILLVDRLVNFHDQFVKMVFIIEEIKLVSINH